MTLYQKSIAELERQAYADLAQFEKYVPTESELKRGKWACVCEKLDEDGDPDWNSPMHIIPMFGNHHYLTERCWCCPRKDNNGFFLHEANA